MNRLARLILLISFFITTITWAQVNYDENKIDHYVLPDPLELKSGLKVVGKEEWEKHRRPEILSLYENQIYGKIPGKLSISSFKIIEEDYTALNNTAIRKQVRLNFTKRGKSLSVYVLIYLPKEVQDPPVFLGLNFYGNQTIVSDKNVHLTDSWIRNNKDLGIIENEATEESRGRRASRWPVQKIIDAGFGIATTYYGDIDPDNNDFSDGIHPFFYDEGQKNQKSMSGDLFPPGLGVLPE